MPRPMPCEAEPLATWRDESACASPPAGMESAWIEEGHPQNLAARGICKTQCPVRYQCLLAALADGDAEGVLGGFHFDNGALETRDRTRLHQEFGFKARAIRRAGRAA